MKIVVCIKQVPDTVEVKIDPKTGVMQGGTDPRGDGLAAGY